MACKAVASHAIEVRFLDRPPTDGCPTGKGHGLQTRGAARPKFGSIPKPSSTRINGLRSSDQIGLQNQSSRCDPSSARHACVAHRLSRRFVNGRRRFDSFRRLHLRTAVQTPP